MEGAAPPLPTPREPGAVDALPPPPRPARRPPSASARARGALRAARSVALLPYLLLKIAVVVPYYLVQAIRHGDRLVAQHEREAREAERALGFSHERVRGRTRYEQATETLQLTLNRDGLKLLAHELQRTWGEPSRARLKLGGPGGELTPEQPGYHVHSEFFLPDLDHELTLYCEDPALGARFALRGGCHLFAPPAHWRALAAQLLGLANAGEAKVLVFDAGQACCQPDSEGRLIVELDPGD